MITKIMIHDSNVRHLFASRRHTNVECILHLHETAEIAIVTEGCVSITVGDKHYKVEKGYGAFVPPFEAHAYSTEKSSKLHVLMFPRDVVSYLAGILDEKAPESHIFAVSDESFSLSEKILPLEYNEVDYIGTQAVLAPLFYDIMKNCVFSERQTNTDTLKGSIEFIREHFRDEITLSDVARAVGQHPVTVSKMLSERMGVGFVSILRYMRCNCALNLLKSSDMTVTDIAYASGFASVRSFNRAFVEVCGTTPSEYRKSESSI